MVKELVTVSFEPISIHNNVFTFTFSCMYVCMYVCMYAKLCIYVIVFILDGISNCDSQE